MTRVGERMGLEGLLVMEDLVVSHNNPPDETRVVQIGFGKMSDLE